MDLTSITPDPTALKALSHPVRLRMLGLLRADGPATASSLALRLGLNSGATSYHLRQLHQHGYVVDDTERGNGRDRWWKAAHQATRARAGAGDAAAREASDAFAQCQVEKVFRAVCFRSPIDADDRGQVSASALAFKSGGNLKRVFAETAAYCSRNE